MKPIFALLVAVTGLFLVWLWASGRAQAVWTSLVSGQADTAPSGFSADPGAAGNSGAGGGDWFTNLLGGNVFGVPIGDLGAVFGSSGTVAAPVSSDPTSPFSYSNTGGFH